LKISKEIKVGFFFILAVGLLIWGYNFLKGQDIFNKEKVYFSRYEKIEGLEVANPVQINGFTVGQVRRLSFAADMSGDIIAEFSLMTDFPIPNNSVARIISSDLLGSKAVQIFLGNSLVNAQSGDTLKSDIETSLKD